MQSTEHITTSYCQFLEELNPNNLQTLKRFDDQNIFFSDPFHQTRGIDEYIAILDTMFQKFNQISFKTENILFNSAKDNNVASFSWTLKMRHKKTNKFIQIIGMSLIEVAQYGLIVRHEDYWDPSSNIYRIIPLLGATIGLVRKKIANNSR